MKKIDLSIIGIIFCFSCGTTLAQDEDVSNMTDVAHTLSAKGTILNNSGFESPSLADGGYAYLGGMSGATAYNNGWYYTGDAGVTRARSGFTYDSAEIPSGKQVAFIQKSGKIKQSIYYEPNSILTFSATQRANNERGLPQKIGVWAAGQRQYFSLGNQGGRVSVSSVEPPSDYYTTYAVKLNLPSYYNYTWIDLELTGETYYADSTAFIDNVLLTTPQTKQYGFWDDNFTKGTWRSDFETSSTVYKTSTNCVSNIIDKSDTDAHRKLRDIVTAGPTPKGRPLDENAVVPCLTLQNPDVVLPSNWGKSADYVPGNPFWVVGANLEALECTTNSSLYGPPNQGLPLLTQSQLINGELGASVVFAQHNSVDDPLIGNRKTVSLQFNATWNKNFRCISNTEVPTIAPYISIGADSHRGNGKPVAIITNDGTYSPILKFNTSLFRSLPKEKMLWTNVTINASGWKDNIPRNFQFKLLEKGTDVNPTGVMTNVNLIWNWNIINSHYYPGGIFAYSDGKTINNKCYYYGVNVPMHQPLSQYTSGGGSQSINSYSINLRSLVQCMVNTNNMWGHNSSSELPDPLIIHHIQWSLETLSGDAPWASPTYGPGADWFTVWNPSIQ